MKQITEKGHKIIEELSSITGSPCLPCSLMDGFYVLPTDTRSAPTPYNPSMILPMMCLPRSMSASESMLPTS